MSDPTSLKRRLAAVLAADVLGYSRMMERDEAGTLALLKQRRKSILEPTLARFSGRVVKWMGDGVLIEFGSAVNAVLFAAELQEKMAAANVGVAPDRAILLRIGINLGDVIVEGSDLYGEGVNIAARLEALADPGGVLIAPSIHDQVRGKVELGFTDLGLKTLKNIAEPLRVYRLDREQTKPANPAASAGADSRKPSIAVLPFSDLSGGSDGSYFVDGIIEEVILELSRFSELLVIARNSSFAFRDQNLDPRAIAEKLNVQYIVTGSLKRADKRIRLSVQLSEAATGANLWAERYDRDLTDIFDLQEELAHTLAITVAGRVKTTAGDRAHRGGTANMSAYDWYLRGRSFLADYGHRDTVEDAAKRAIDLDPGFADAHALLGFAHAIHYLVTDDPACLARAEAPCLKAIELAPDSAFANIAMGFVWRTGPRHREGLRYAARAVELNPNDTLALMMWSCNLLYWDSAERALETMDYVFRRDPYPLPWFWDVYGMGLTVTGRYPDALAAFDRLTEMQSWSCCFRAICEHELGQTAAAQESVRRAIRLFPDMNIAKAERMDPIAAPGFTERRRAALAAAGMPEA